MGGCNDHDVLDNKLNVYKCEGAIKNIGFDARDEIEVTLYNNLVLTVGNDDLIKQKKVVRGLRKIFVYVHNKKASQKLLIDIKDPDIFSFKASVINISEIKDEIESSLHICNDGISVNVLRYELMFIEGPPS